MTNKNTRETLSSRLFVRAAIGCLLAISAIAFAPPPAAPFALSTDFFQAANLGPPPGDIDWIGSILQANNSIYAEGMSVPQRLVFLEIPSTAGNNHVLTFSHQATKATDVHAYDFLTSWGQAIAAAEDKGPGDADLLFSLSQLAVIVENASSQTATNTQMLSLWDPATNPNVATGDIDDAMPNVGGGTGDVGAQITAYEAALGNRQVTVRAPTGAGNAVSNVVCDFIGYSASGSDFFAEYELRWTSASPTIGIEFAGHLGVGEGDGIVPGYGAGFGASNINGGPYHFKLGNLDTSSLGSIDNQIKGADIIIPPPVCQLTGPTTACQGDTGLLFTNGAVFDPTITYLWSFLSNTSGASFASANGSNTMTVNAGASAGSFEIQLSKTNAGGTTTCSQVVTVNATTSTTDPPNQTVCTGTSVSFTTVTSGTGPFTYSWTKDGAPLAGETTATLNLGAVDESDEAEYCVTVVGTCGSDTECATLVVNPATSTTDPPDQTVCSGTSVTFTTVASGTGPFTFAWTFNGNPIGGNSPSLPLGFVDETDEGTYCVTVTGACGPPVEQCAELTISAGTSTTEPPDQEVCSGESVSFTTTPSGTGPFTFAWTFEGAPIGGNTATLNLGPVDESDEGTYCVTVTGTCGPSAPQCAELVVNANTSTTDPANQTVCAGASVSFTTSPSGTGPFTFAWTFDGNPIGGNTATLNLGVVDESDEGEYCVTVTGECGPPVEQCATLTVNAATTTTDPPNQTVCAGASVSFTTTPSGTGPFTFAWTFDGNPIGGNTATLNLGVVDESDEGEYCVTVTGACGPPVEQCATLTVNDAVTTTDPDDQVACEGEDVCFSTTPSGTGPFTFVWTKTGDPTVLSTTSELCIDDIEAEDEGTYCVSVTGACGGPAEQCATLDINRPPRVQELADKEVCPGEPVEWTAIVTGTGPFTFKWYKADDPATVLDTDDTFEIPSRTLEDAGDYCVDVTGFCGDPVTKCATLTVMVCDEVFCTFTQGFWGNPNGKFNGQDKEQLLTQPPFNLMATALTVGVIGERSLTINPENWECIILRLPAGGTPTTLPDFGDQTMGADPGCVVPNLPLKNGKFLNVFLGQVITLSLNVRFDPELVDLELCNLMTTLEIDPGPDGLVHTDDDVPIPGTEKVVFISPVIMDALDNLGLDQTVGGLLELANRALAGMSTGGASISAINGAVDAINVGFDECRLMTSCEAL